MEDPDKIDSPNVMLTVALHSSIWCTLYFTLCLVNYKRSYEWNVRLVTALHALTVTGLGLWCAFVQGPWPFTDAGIVVYLFLLPSSFKMAKSLKQYVW